MILLQDRLSLWVSFVGLQILISWRMVFDGDVLMFALVFPQPCEDTQCPIEICSDPTEIENQSGIVADSVWNVCVSPVCVCVSPVCVCVRAFTRVHVFTCTWA